MYDVNIPPKIAGGKDYTSSVLRMVNWIFLVEGKPFVVIFQGSSRVPNASLFFLDLTFLRVSKIKGLFAKRMLAKGVLLLNA